MYFCDSQLVSYSHRTYRSYRQTTLSGSRNVITNFTAPKVHLVI